MSGASAEGPATDRVARAEALLRREGVVGRVTAAGADGEIAAVAASPDALVRVRALAEEIRALGFGYVALDLASSGEQDE